MILPCQDITNLKLLSPCLPRGVDLQVGMSYGLSGASYDLRVRGGFTLWPKSTKLASAIEKFTLPANVAGVVHDKSTLARRFVTVQNTFIDAGWTGYLTLEITNHSWKFVRIYSGQPIAQVVFHYLRDATERPYQGKYNHQEPWPVPARFES